MEANVPDRTITISIEVEMIVMALKLGTIGTIDVIAVVNAPQK